MEKNWSDVSKKIQKVCKHVIGNENESFPLSVKIERFNNITKEVFLDEKETTHVYKNILQLHKTK